MSFVFVRILFVSLLCKSGFGQSRVNQGKPITIEDAPYMARVNVIITPIYGLGCDGSILNDLFILTAGHCVTDESNINVPNPPLHGPSSFTIQIGTADLSQPELAEVFYVSKVFFREYSTTNDMAILKLSSRIQLNGKTKMAVTLPTNTNYYPNSRTNAYVDGWGENPQNSQILLRANIYTLAAEECNTAANAGRDRISQICTLGENGAGPCQGDSGGPLLRADDGVQIGLVSFVSLNCPNPDGLQSIFTAVAPNLNWIRRVMNENGDYNQVQAESSMVTDNVNPAKTTTTTTTTRRPMNLFGFPFEGLLNSLLNQQ